ncbi:Oidioi.mRNA.OKI2018_I69.chr2.g4263.t2.cds [Oikopleura dioica]|uniref:Oidioi.mRNA.OKI2018_I69.chr2.g4263.t2.cds n=1 Tax=Oikopleura dioica TaxID=34765 RepID=A0ABN7SWR8_OIKDI|nr:Oidioi.mRNA.OKI2018_I69.chr2.g4263.t2.cds [Oikopleura dioica]
MRCRVLYDFTGENSSELTVREGEELVVTSKGDDDGWWTAKNPVTGAEGIVPASYVEEIAEENYDDVPDNDSFTSDSDPGWGGAFGTPAPPPAANGPVPEPARSPQGSASPEHAPSSSVSSSRSGEPVNQPSGTTKGVVGKDISRFKKYIKVGAEDFIIGLAPKKADRKLYEIVDPGHLVQWRGGMNTGIQLEITSTEQGRKGMGMKVFTLYEIHNISANVTVKRRYKHFDWLAARLKEQFPVSLLPRLPEKQQNGRFDEHFVKRRKTLLNAWIKEVCRHPIVCNSKLITSFITIKDADQKEWKNYKRSMEKTPYQLAGFFQAVDVPSNSPFLKDSENQMKKFEQFSGGMDKTTSQLADALSRSLKTHDTSIKSEIIHVGRAFDELGKVFASKQQKEGSVELATATAAAGKTFEESAQLVTSSALESTIPFLDNLWLYDGLLSHKDGMVEVGKQTKEKIETNRKKLSGTSADKELQIKSDTINGALLSEADYLDEIRIPDFTRNIKQYLSRRAEYHRRQMELFEAAAAKFPDL